MAHPTTTFRPTISPPGRTFASQHTLPKLPIPSLDVTCKRYLTALRGLQDDKEHFATQRAVQAFLDGEGPALQERLNEWAKERAR
jgi:carnitine O-acetyltransferase